MDRTIAERQTYVDNRGALWAVISVIPAADQICLRAANGISRIETIHDFQHKIVEGAYKITSGLGVNDAPPPQRLFDLTPNQRVQLSRRKRIVDYIEARTAEGLSLHDIEVELRARADVYPMIPSSRQLRRWLAANRKGQLVPGKPGWVSGRRRVHIGIMRVIDAVVDRLRVNGTRELTNLQTMLRHINNEARQRGYEGQKDAISLKTLKETLAQRAAWGEDLRSYMSPSAHRAITRVAVRFMEAERPLEVVEVDSLTPSYHIFSPEGEDIGQPTIYVGVDVATGCVVGIKAYAMPSGVEPLMDFYEHMFFPKEPRPDGWAPPWGRPERVLSDLGPEFRASFASGVAQVMGYEHLFAEGEAGWKKPHVEEVNGDLQTEFLYRIAGSTKSAVTRKLDISLPERTGGLTLDVLNAKLQAFAWDIHAKRTSDRLRIKFRDPDMTPAKAWDKLCAEYPPMLPISREEFRESTYECLGTGQVDHAGVRYDNLDYNSDELAALYRVIGPATVELYGSPMDAGTILVKHKPSSAIALAHSKQDLAHGLSRRTWKVLKKTLRLGRNAATDREISDAHSALIHEATDMAVGGSMRARRRAAAKAQSMSLAGRTSPSEGVKQDSPPHPVPPVPVQQPDRLPPPAASGRTPIVSFDPKASS